MPYLTADALHTDPEGLAILRIVLRRPRLRVAESNAAVIGEARRSVPRSVALSDVATVGRRTVRPRKAATRS
jgi:hypothetical protein